VDQTPSATTTDEVAAAWFAAMRRGDWNEAWRQTDRVEEPRRAAQRRGGFVRQAQHLLWDGSAFTGRSVLVRCEHGLGDTLQFIRFAPLIAQVAREVNLLVQPQLLALLAGAPGLGTVRNAWAGEPAPDHDVEIEIMELAYALRADVGKLPPPYPHLRERAAGRAEFALQRDGHLRVGLLWAASHWDDSRTIALPALEPLLRVERARFFSLQQGEAAHDPLLERLPIVSLSSRTREIPLAAAAMLELDLVITIDGMPAHLAASLGRPTWTLLKHEADWRWMHERSDTPWYPTMRLLRQPRPGDWDAVVRAAATALSKPDSPA
jgi:hypothetical protein